VKRDLQLRRDRAAQQHDDALAADPSRSSDRFRIAMRAVIGEIEAVCALAEGQPSDAVELSRTYRFLGSACYDLANGKDHESLERSCRAYERAEALLTGVDAPLERAKLDFNFGNTLRALSDGSNVELLEATLARYESASDAFKKNGQSGFATEVARHLPSLGLQLSLARRNAELQKAGERLAELENAAAKPNHDEQSIRSEMADIRRIMGISDTSDSGFIDQVAAALKARVRSELASGRLPSYRSTALIQALDEMAAIDRMPRVTQNDISRQADRSRALKLRFRDIAANPTWGDNEANPLASAQNAIRILSGLTRYLFAEFELSMLGHDDSTRRLELFKRRVELEAAIRREHDDGRLVELEGDAWRLAVEIQEFARRNHATVATPVFAAKKAFGGARSLFVAGDESLIAATRILADRFGYDVHDRVTRGERAQGRWEQLSASTLGVFDVTAKDARVRAGVCYELGLALALGKPAVIVTGEGTRSRLPFDVTLEPVSLTGNATTDAEVVHAAIVDALGSVVWGGAHDTAGAFASAALRRLDEEFAAEVSEGLPRQARVLANDNRDDPVAFRRALDQLLGILGPAAPSVLLPAWPPAYPRRDEAPRCFHVMPFGPAWANDAREAARAECSRHGWVYVRGDESNEQRIIPGIWLEISRASAILVDITGRTPNVALELGLAHALGRRCGIVAQGNPADHLFDGVDKTQVRGYEVGPPFHKLTSLVGALLEQATVPSR